VVFMVGIVGYGVYVPKYRITVEEIARVWKKDGKAISAGLNVKEKAVGSFDEDACTIAVEAARRAVAHSGIEASSLGAVYVGSESHPYAVKPTASVVADAIGASPEMTAADLEFACKAGTAGIQMCLALVDSKMPGWIKYGMSIGADTAQGRPNDALEFTTASGGAAFIVGKKEEEIIANVLETYSFTTDTPDFWRRQHAEFPSHAGRFTGEPAYFRHVVAGAEGIMKRTNMKPSDFDYAVFHQPNGKFPVRVAKKLGFEKKQIEQGLTTPHIGNTYSASMMIGLASVLDKAKEGEKILGVSYGSGAGSDAFVFEATKNIGKKRPKKSVFEMFEEKEYIDYAEYVKFRRKLKSL
jgi:hydroxymethylglutaryl-CoA synthase